MIRFLLLITAIAATPAFAEDASPAPAAANAAADLCVKDGAKVEIETAPNGSQRGICVFPSGSRIAEWAYFRNKHRTQH